MKALLCILLVSASAHASERVAVVVVGDSLTNGYSFTSKPATDWLEELVGVPVDNMGVNGDVAANMRTRWQLYAKTYPYRVLVIEACTNDLALGGSAASCWATVQAWIAEAQTAGIRVIVCTVFPRSGSGGWTGGMETERLAYNALVRAAASSTVRVFDGDEVLSDDGVSLKAEYNYGDNLHLNDAGQEAYGRGLFPLVRP